MKDIMIDLETLGTGNDAVFVTIGAVYFDPETGKLGDEFYMNVDIQSSLDAGRVVTGATIKWWLDQKPEALKEIVKNGAELVVALTALTNFIQHRSTVWGNGSTFDISILEDAFIDVSVKVPWAFWDVNDVRTVKRMGKDFVHPDIFKMKGTAHNALDDAKHQARYVSACWQALRAPKALTEQKPKEALSSQSIMLGEV